MLSQLWRIITNPYLNGFLIIKSRVVWCCLGRLRCMFFCSSFVLE
uniref:Uncharacterized protein n=1 Tax=Rhizophora mucronata TaxID=61149 RepID=A0A2P2QUS0_RHIMU